MFGLFLTSIAELEELELAGNKLFVLAGKIITVFASCAFKF